MAANRLIGTVGTTLPAGFASIADPPLRLALFEPDIPQNTGSLLRVAACFGVPIDLIEPFGFVPDDRRIRRAALDYAERATICRHASWGSYLARRDAGSRLVLLTTRGSIPLHRFAFAACDTLLLGRESAGVPEFVHRSAEARVRIPMRQGARSLNVAVAGAIALAEALRQTGALDVLCGPFDGAREPADI